MHEPRENEFVFTGQADLVSFIKLAAGHRLNVIVRPGPYICAEWEFGGLPAWLLTKNVQLRSADGVFLFYVERYFRQLFKLLRPLLYPHGGPIIMVQIENEYGSFGCNLAYLQALRSIVEKYLQLQSNEVVLFTTDGFTPKYFTCGSFVSSGTNGVLATVDFGPSKANFSQRYVNISKYQPSAPLVNSEFYVGWLDNWAKPHCYVPTADMIDNIDRLLDMGSSFAMYMFHGGTNFAFWNGANYNVDTKTLFPQPTSYDYDSPLSEAGDMTYKYELIKKTILNWRQHQGFNLKTLPVVSNSTKTNIDPFVLQPIGSLFDVLPSITDGPTLHSHSPRSMEFYNQSFGFTLYRTVFDAPGINVMLSIDLSTIADRAHIFVNEKLVQIVDAWNRSSLPQRETLQLLLTLEDSSPIDVHLDLFVENMGRINYGPELANNRKGFFGQVTACSWTKLERSNQCDHSRPINDWTVHRLDFENINLANIKSTTSRINLNPIGVSIYDGRQFVSIGLQTNFIPTVYSGEFTLKMIGDTFLNSVGWSKGIVFVNSYNLGRYWPVVGPQLHLYVPSVYLARSNRILLFELDKPRWDLSVSFDQSPKWSFSKTKLFY